MAKAKVAKAQPARTIADNTATKASKTIGENASRKVWEAKLAAGQAKRRVQLAVPSLPGETKPEAKIKIVQLLNKK